MADLAKPIDLTARFPEFANVPPLVIQAALDDADLQINPNVWGAMGLLGECTLAAHLLITRGALVPAGTDQSGAQGSGPIQNMKVGDVSISYDGTAIANAVIKGELNVAFASTKYGLEYTRLLGLLAAGGSVTGC